MVAVQKFHWLCIFTSCEYILVYAFRYPRGHIFCKKRFPQVENFCWVGHVLIVNDQWSRCAWISLYLHKLKPHKRDHDFIGQTFISHVITFLVWKHIFTLTYNKCSVPPSALGILVGCKPPSIKIKNKTGQIII